MSDRSHRPGYEGVRADVQELVPRSCRNILEFGCSTGALGEALKARQGARVTGVELDEGLAAEAREKLDEVIVGDVAAFVGAHEPKERFDCLIAADVLEHLADPWQALREATRFLSPGATVVVSVPNVFYWSALLRAIRSQRWPRDREGTFDRTHLRWFGPEDARELLVSAGLTDVSIHPRYWSAESRRGLVERLGRTALGPFLAAQISAVGTAP
jgi:2-polyprenyl-3-methyl-5-hydroxy-6-metoxy-1,4-benzoquinol methylase